VLFRTAVGKWAAWIATVVFALSPTLAVPIVWLANRAVLLSLTFGAFALALYVRWRDDRSRGLGLATTGAFGAAALTGEYALCFLGYLISFELCRRGEPIRRRLVGVLPALVPFLLYAAARAVLGYGTAGTGFYRDPTTDLGTYLQALPRTFCALLASAWLLTDVTMPWFASHLAQAPMVVGAGVLMVGTIRKARQQTSPGGGAWLACGAVVALLPVAASEPTRRLLAVAALGISGAIGVLLAEAADRIRARPRPSLVVGVAAIAGFIHLIVAPLQTRRQSYDEVEDQSQSIARFTTVPQRARSIDTALVVRASNGLTALSAPFVLREAAPKHWLVLSHTFGEVAAIRTSASSVDLVQENAALFPLGPTGIVRTTPFRVGDVVETAALRATVLRVDEAGRPLAVHYEFNRDLDSSDIAWISEGRSGFSYVIPPPVGIGVRLSR